MTVLYSNNAVSSLASLCGAGATSLSVQSGDGVLFPNPGLGEYFYIRLGTDDNNEVVKVTARSTDTLTCEATAYAWAASTAVALTVCAEMLDDFLQEAAAATTYQPLDGDLTAIAALTDTGGYAKRTASNTWSIATPSAADVSALPTAGGTMSGDINCADNNVNRAELKDTSETAPTITISTGAITANFESGNVQKVTHDANITSITISNPPASGTAGAMTLLFVQDATGGRTIAGWPAAVLWAGGSAPTWSTTANKVNICTLITIDAGTTYYGNLVGKDYA